MIVLAQENPVYYYTDDKKFRAELPTLVFIHGAQNDHSVWNLQSHQFANQGYNVIAIDLPGHGLSKGNAKTSINAMAQWLLVVFDVIGIKNASNVSLIGHSMGSLIALETARIAPERITKLALLGSAYPMRVADALLTMAHENEPVAIDMVASWSHTDTGNLKENSKQLMQRMSAANPHQLLFTDLSACNNYAQGEEAAAVINRQHCPTLFVMAQQDRMTPAKASAKLRAAIPEARVVEIADCGHAMMAERPDAVLTALVDFLG